MELILRESKAVLRCVPGVIVVEHRLGFVMANAGIDQSNVAQDEDEDNALLLPQDPDASCARLRAQLRAETGADVAVVIIDSHGRAWREGIVGVAIGVAGMPALLDLRGQPDRFGRKAQEDGGGPCGRARIRGIAVDGTGGRRLSDRPVRGHPLRPARWRGHRAHPAARGRILLVDCGTESDSVLALAGGVGGAKLAHGLAMVLPAETMTVIVNTGDDFEHLGLAISPDLDTVMYTLAGLADFERGWGLAEETWQFMSALERLHGPTWFRLGDRDLATHVHRTTLLAGGATLSSSHRRVVPSAGRATRRRPDVRRPRAHLCRHGRRHAVVPGLLRSPALRTASPRHSLRRRGQGDAVRGLAGGVGRIRPPGGGRVPVEPVPKHRSSARGAWRSRSALRICTGR